MVFATVSASRETEMDLLMAIVSAPLAALGTLGLVAMAAYWLFLRPNGVHDRLMVTVNLWALVVAAVGFLGLRVAGTMPDFTSIT
jgi:hypothetical protein